jgi:hypothetical protein
MSVLLAQSFAIAALLWGQPACGMPTVVDDPALPPDALGYNDRRSCTIDLASPRPAAYDTAASVCTTIVHEWGHLTGHAHSANPRSVMYPEQLQPYWRCRDRWRTSMALLVGS